MTIRRANFVITSDSPMTAKIGHGHKNWYVQLKPRGSDIIVQSLKALV